MPNDASAARERRFRIREFEPADQAQVVRLLRRTFDRPGGGVHDDTFFRWKHVENPFGPSLMHVAEAGGRIIGFQAIMRWRLQTEGGVVEAGRPTDTVTDPEWRGLGVFARLNETTADTADRHGMQVLFTTPNELSYQGLFKVGWVQLGRAKRDLLIGGPSVLGSIALGGWRLKAFGGPCGDEMAGWEHLAAALPQRPRGPQGMGTHKDHAYVLWRYVRHPWFRYRVIADGSMLAVVRSVAGHRVSMAILAESTATDPGEWRRLLLEVAARTVSPVVQVLRVRSLEAPNGRGWIRLTRAGPMVFARSARPEFLTLETWSLTTGDLEFF